VAFLATFLAFFLAAIDLSLFLSWVGIEGGALHDEANQRLI